MAKKQDFPEDRAPSSARRRPKEPTEGDNIRLRKEQMERIENDIDREGTAAGGSSSSRDHSDNKPDRPREGGGGGGSQSSKPTPN